MKSWELVAASLLYISVAFRCASNGETGMALTFFAYALANVGLIWAMK